MSDLVKLNAIEIQALNRYQQAIDESERDIAKMREAQNTLLACVWVRGEGNPEIPFRLGDDKQTLVAVQQ